MFRKTLLLIFAVWLIAAQAVAQKSPAVDSVTVADAAFEKAFSSKNLEGAMKFYADDAVTMEPGMPLIKGKEEIRKQLQSFLAMKDFALNWKAEAAEVAKSGDLAYTRGTFDAQFTDPASGKLVKEHGKYVTIWKKIGGEWKVTVDINNTDGPTS